MSKKIVFFLLGRSPIASPVLTNKFPERRKKLEGQTMIDGG
jgi:hypothetical protein